VKIAPPFILAALLLTACQTMPPLPELAAGAVRTGQVRYSSPGRSFIGEFWLRESRGSFQLEITKGPGIRLISVREVGGKAARVEGGGRSWQGTPDRAPRQLQSWLSLDDALAGRDGRGAWTVKQDRGQTKVTFAGTGERFEFHFNDPAP
jgi:hypothetical protein